MRRTTVIFITEAREQFTDLHKHLVDNEIELKYFSCSNDSLTDLFSIQPDLLLLDCGEEGVDELTLCQKIRNVYDGPLILLSRQEKEQFAMLALKLGADISLPAQNSALITAANLRSLLRRFGSTPLQELHFGALTIDSRRHDAFLFGQRVNLSTVEFQLLWLLSQKAGHVVSRDAIHRELYNTSYNGYDRNIDLYVSRIRQKIGDNPASPEYLKTVRGTGYQFVGVPGSKTDC